MVARLIVLSKDGATVKQLLTSSVSSSIVSVVFFFFSSRRRHTRSDRDWSSDVCSSDLAAAYYAGHRDASVRIVDSIEQLGGQVAAVYPEKNVYDVAGHPKILGRDLVEIGRASCRERV